VPHLLMLRHCPSVFPVSSEGPSAGPPFQKFLDPRKYNGILNYLPIDIRLKTQADMLQLPRSKTAAKSFMGTVNIQVDQSGYAWRACRRKVQIDENELNFVCNFLHLRTRSLKTDPKVP
jgi:hypothetical protein